MACGAVWCRVVACHSLFVYDFVLSFALCSVRICVLCDCIRQFYSHLGVENRSLARSVCGITMRFPRITISRFRVVHKSFFIL